MMRFQMRTNYQISISLVDFARLELHINMFITSGREGGGGGGKGKKRKRKTRRKKMGSISHFFLFFEIFVEIFIYIFIFFFFFFFFPLLFSFFAANPTAAAESLTAEETEILSQFFRNKVSE